MGRRLIVYDLDEVNEKKLMNICKDYMIFSANPMVKHCMGCFGCWVKTPGRCVIKDRCDVMTSYIPKCSELIIISPILYGGYSEKVKAVLERANGYILPYFRIINGKMHHKMRYDNPFNLKVIFYGNIDEDEKDIAKRLVKANAANLGAGDFSVSFIDLNKLAEEVQR